MGEFGGGSFCETFDDFGISAVLGKIFCLRLTVDRIYIKKKLVYLKK